jgi:hypothetical protein
LTVQLFPSWPTGLGVTGRSARPEGEAVEVPAEGGGAALRPTAGWRISSTSHACAACAHRIDGEGACRGVSGSVQYSVSKSRPLTRPHIRVLGLLHACVQGPDRRSHARQACKRPAPRACKLPHGLVHCGPWRAQRGASGPPAHRAPSAPAWRGPACAPPTAPRYPCRPGPCGRTLRAGQGRNRGWDGGRGEDSACGVGAGVCSEWEEAARASCVARRAGARCMALAYRRRGPAAAHRCGGAAQATRRRRERGAPPLRGSHARALHSDLSLPCCP